MKQIVTLFFMLLLAATFNSCGKGEPFEYEVELQFKVVANGEVVDVITPSNHENAFSQTYTVSKFQMLISDIFLSPNATSSLKSKHVEEAIPPEDIRIAEYHFFDIQDSATHTLTATANAKYAYLNFRFGLNADDNTSNSLPSDYDGFFWPPMMGGGYHYMKFEGNTDSTTPTGFAMHAGPNDGIDYSFDVSLPITQSIVNDKMILVVTIDLNNFFSDDFEFTFPIRMIMGNNSAQEKIQANGVDVFALE